MLANSRFNPTSGIVDFWHEFRKPNPFRAPILLASMAPFGLIFWWLSGETVYKAPERPQITYISTSDPDRTDEEIIASNLANQEVKDLREADAERREERKRELYKALGAAAGMDVEEIDRRGREAREAEAAQERAELDAMFGRSTDPEAGNGGSAEAPEASSEGLAP